MKILQIGKYYPPRYGGIETVLETLSESLARRGHTVTVICANDKFSTEIQKKNGVRVIRLACLGALFSQPIVPGLLLYLIRESATADIVHIHSPNPLAEFFSFFSRNEIFVTYHADVVRQKGLLFAYSLLQKVFLGRAKKIFVASEAIRRTSPTLAPFRDKIQVVPFGLAGERFNTDAAASSFLEKIQREYAPYILFVGRLVAYKGLPVLLKAIQNIEAKLILVGDGPDR